MNIYFLLHGYKVKFRMFVFLLRGYKIGSFECLQIFECYMRINPSIRECYMRFSYELIKVFENVICELIQVFENVICDFRILLRFNINIRML